MFSEEIVETLTKVSDVGIDDSGCGAQWYEKTTEVPGSIPGLAFLVSSYK